MGWGTADVAGVRAELREMQTRIERVAGLKLKELRAAYMAYVVTPKKSREKAKAVAEVAT